MTVSLNLEIVHLANYGLRYRSLELSMLYQASSFSDLILFFSHTVAILPKGYYIWADGLVLKIYKRVHSGQKQSMYLRIQDGAARQNRAILLDGLPTMRSYSDIMFIWYRWYICTADRDTTESDPHSYEATKAVAKKAQKKNSHSLEFSIRSAYAYNLYNLILFTYRV